MDELFLKMESKNVPISQDMIKKYNLKKGIKSPFTNAQIVDVNGDFTLEQNETKIKDTGYKENQTIFTQAETLG